METEGERPFEIPSTICQCSVISIFVMAGPLFLAIWSLDWH